MDRFLHLIVNRQSRNGESVFKKLLIEIPKYTQHFQIYVTNDVDELEDVIKQLQVKMDPEDIVISIGGDGSLNSIVTLFEQYGIHNDLGYIPSGSGNDFARTHHMPIETSEAIDYLFNLKAPKELAILHATEGDKNYYAVNSLGIGIDGAVIHNITNHSLKRVLGPATYISGVLSAFVRLKKFPVTTRVNEGTFKFDNVQLALVTNNPFFGGGIKIVPDADGTDDTLELLIANDVTGKELAIILWKLFKNKNHLEHPKLHLFKAKQIALYTESAQEAQKDGEPFSQNGYALTFGTKKRSFWI